MTLNKSIAKPGDIITLTGCINRMEWNRREGMKRMLFEPKMNGKYAGDDVWLADKYKDAEGEPVYNDATNLENINIEVGDIVEVTGTVYPYKNGKIGIFNLTSMKVVGKAEYSLIEQMMKEIPRTAIDAANIDTEYSAPKPYMDKKGTVHVVAKKPQWDKAMTSLYR